MQINNIFVIGAGTMGNGIAQTAANAGYLGRKPGQGFYEN